MLEESWKTKSEGRGKDKQKCKNFYFFLHKISFFLLAHSFYNLVQFFLELN